MLSFIVVLSFVSAISALPNGAPICQVGPGVTRNEHVRASRNPQTGPNEKDGNYAVQLNGVPILAVPVTDPTFVNVFQFGQLNNLVLQSVGTPYFKGLLVIASAGNVELDVDVLDTRTPNAINITDPNTKESIGCENFKVSSAVHVINTEKASVSMGFQWPTEGQKLFLDINIVKNNNVTVGSQYYYTQYPMLSADIPPPDCGLLNLNLFCPGTRCGLFGRLLGLCDN